MRLLIISPSYPPDATGEAEHCYQIAARLAAHGHDVRVLSNRHAQAKPADGFRLQADMSGWGWRQLPGLLRRIRQHSPDAVLLIYTAWLYDGHPMITFLPTLLRRRQPGLRFLTLVEVADGSAHGGWFTRLGRKLMRLAVGTRSSDFALGTLLRDSTTVAVLGPGILAGLQANDPKLADRAIVIPPPPLLPPPPDRSPAARAAARAALGVHEGDFVLAFFGYVYPGKGIETLLAATSRLLQAGRQVRLVMAGGGRNLQAPPEPFEAAMRQRAHDLGIEAQVLWPAGYSGRAETTAGQLLAADAAVLPFDDGAELRRSSIAVVTAIGLPLITTTPGPAETAFEQGRNVLVSEPHDDAALAVNIGRVIDEPALRLMLSRGADELVATWFSWGRAIRQIEAALNRPPT
jgi:glycosyltransferase involved in cell wall biosynthesis